MEHRSRPGVECRSWPKVELDLGLRGAQISAHGGAALISTHDGASISPAKNEEMRKEMEMGL